MPAPVLLAVDADHAALGHVERELRDRYASSYRVIGTRSPDKALAILTRLSDAGEEVALVLAHSGSPKRPAASCSSACASSTHTPSAGC
jgi:hypothetical protein